MNRRHQEMTELAQIPRDRRLAHIRDRLGLALELADIIEDEALIRIPTEHFVRWIAVIDSLTGPEGAPRAPREHEGGGPELDRLIEEGRRARGGDAPRRS